MSQADNCQKLTKFAHQQSQTRSPQYQCIPNLVKIHWHLFKLLSENKNMDMSRADNYVKNWWNWYLSNPKPDLHNINAYTKFSEKLLTFTQVIIQKQQCRRVLGHIRDMVTLPKTDEICPLTIPNMVHVKLKYFQGINRFMLSGIFYINYLEWFISNIRSVWLVFTDTIFPVLNANSVDPDQTKLFANVHKWVNLVHFNF